METKAPNHPQLNLPFDTNSQVEITVFTGTAADEQVKSADREALPHKSTSSAVVVDFQTVLSSRRTTASSTAEAGLYRRILETVRNIG